MENLRKYKIAVVQMDSRNDKGANLKYACQCIDEAAANGAKLISFPEIMNLSGENVGEGGGHETIPGYTTEILMAKAKEHKMYIHSGSFCKVVEGENRAYNTSVIIDPEGAIIGEYHKLHPFDITMPDGSVNKESDRIRPGDEIVVTDTAIGKLGMSICYDIRFPELYRIMTLEGAQVIFTPASFTMSTGKEHWECILRTRAIENACYIVAADQIGQKRAFPAYGHSMVIDPWGTVIAKARDEAGMFYADIDLDYEDKVRQKVPVLENRRADIYEVKRR